MRLDSRINAILLDRIKVYVDARVDEKIADALENRGVKDSLGAGVADSRLFRGGRSVPRCYLFRPRSG